MRPPGTASPSGKSIYVVEHWKFLSQQWQMANDYENCILEPRGVWTSISLQCTSNMRAITFLFVDQSSSHRLEKVVEDIHASPEVIGARITR